MYSIESHLYIFTLATLFPSMNSNELSSFVDKDICPREKRSLASSRINKFQDWSTLCSIDVTSWQRLLNVMAEHVYKFLCHVFRLIRIESSRITLKNNLKISVIILILMRLMCILFSSSFHHFLNYFIFSRLSLGLSK